MVPRTKVAAVAAVVVNPAAAAAPPEVAADRAVAVVDVPLVVAVDKAVDKAEEEAVARVVVAADLPAVVVEWEVVAVVVNPAVAGAAETVNSLSSSGASRACGAPLFIDALLRRDISVAAVDRAARRHVFPAAPLALAG